MPIYVISSNSYIKVNVYKIGYSSKNINELLSQYEKSKRTIPNPFLIQWWNEGSLKNEKYIHNILRNIYKIENIDGEWYKCDNLLYLLTIINNEIFNIKKIENNERIKNASNIIIHNLNNEKNKTNILIKCKYILSLFNIQKIKLDKKYIKNVESDILIINDIEYLTYNFLMLYITNNKIKYKKYKSYIIEDINKSIKNNILNLDKIYFNNLIKITNRINFINLDLPIINISKIIELDKLNVDLYFLNNLKKINIYSSFKKDFELSSKEYIKINEKSIYNTIVGYLNNEYFILENIKIDEIKIKVYYEDTNKILSISEYIKNINYKCLNDTNNKTIIKSSKVLYYSFKIVLLNNIDKNVKINETYNLLDLDNINISTLFSKNKIKEMFCDRLIYSNGKNINIKNYTLYQLLYYNRNVN